MTAATGSVAMRAATLALALLLSPAAVAGPGETRSAGRQVFEQWCEGCHADSPFAPGTTALKATRGADKAVLERRRDLPGAYIRAVVRKGYAGMPLFRRIEISADELDALVEYLASP